MALNATTLGSSIASIVDSNVRTAFSLGAPPLYPKLTQFAQALGSAIATEVVNHFKNNAELDNAKFTGTFGGTVSGGTCSTTITNQPVTGGIK